MNLEYVEQKCLSILAQVTNPLVPVYVLMNHLRADPECPPIEETELLAFLRNHEDIRVIEPSGESQEDGNESAREALGLPTGPRVILNARVPTQGESLAQIDDQLDTLTQALTVALQEARLHGNTGMEMHITDALQRAERMRLRARNIFGCPSETDRTQENT